MNIAHEVFYSILVLLISCDEWLAKLRRICFGGGKNNYCAIGLIMSSYNLKEALHLRVFQSKPKFLLWLNLLQVDNL